jgi:hypothetical protein
MKRSKSLALIILLLGLLASSVAWAHGHGHHGSPGARFHHPGFQHPGFRQHHGHHHGHASAGVIIGAPWPYYYSPPPAYVYYPPLTVAPASPPVYIEQGSELGGAEAAPNYWYYCSNPQGYYPYLRDCPSGWQQVPATPSTSR